jgi:hypothetical protein
MQATISTADNTRAGAVPYSPTNSWTVPSSKKRLWTGRALGTLAVLFFAFDTVSKLLQLAPAMEATTQLGYPASTVLGIGLIELVCVVAYVVPRTSVLGAILLTGYLGGAIATHVRVESPLFSHTLFPIYIAVLVWGGLFLRDNRLRALAALRPRA